MFQIFNGDRLDKPITSTTGTFSIYFLRSLLYRLQQRRILYFMTSLTNNIKVMLQKQNMMRAYVELQRHARICKDDTSRWLRCSFMIYNGAETNCRIAHNLGILLMNSNYFSIFFCQQHSSCVCSDIYMETEINVTSAANQSARYICYIFIL